MRITTIKGYDFFEATSAFQKSIRRGDETTALFFMAEFFNSGYDEYLWKRLKIIVSEDIGLAEPVLPATIAALYGWYQELKKENKEGRGERMYLTHAVLLCVRAKKSRIVDGALVYTWRWHHETKIDVPDYAYDKHNMKGKSMGRGNDHFWTEGVKCENFHPQPGEEEMMKKAKAWMDKHPKISFRPNKKGTITQRVMSTSAKSGEINFNDDTELDD